MEKGFEISGAAAGESDDAEQHYKPDAIEDFSACELPTKNRVESFAERGEVDDGYDDCALREHETADVLETDIPENFDDCAKEYEDEYSLESPVDDDNDRIGEALIQDAVTVMEREIDDSSHERLREQYRDDTDPDKREQIRALDELLTLEECLELTDGDPDIRQIGGRYGDIVKEKLSGYHAHHIPPKSVSDSGQNNLPAIYLTAEDHAKTDSFGGRMGAKSKSVTALNLDIPKDSRTYKQKLISQISEGNYADAFRNEVYEIRDKFGGKYDGAIKQAIEANQNYLKSSGNPKVKK